MVFYEVEFYIVNVDGNVITSSLVDFMSFFMNNTIVDGNDIAFSLS
jgi:hypothetical protein